MRSDQELIRAVGAGDAEALRRLYERHAPAVMGMAVRVLRDRHEAEDVVTEVFWRVWEGAERYDATRGSVRGYLLLLGRSRAIDRLRTKRSRGGTGVGVGTAETPGRAEDSAVSPGAGPAEHAEVSERSEAVRRELAELPPEQLEALELSFFKGLSHREIAEQTGQPLGTIKSRLRIGLIRLRDRLRHILKEGGNP